MKLDCMILPSELNSIRDSIRETIRSIKDRRIHILIEPEKKVRSTGQYSQNHHLNGHIQQIAISTGQPFEDVKKYVKQMAIGQGYPIKTFSGYPVLDMWGQVVGISETEATTEQCAMLIDCTHRLAAELGIRLQETGDGMV